MDVLVRWPYYHPPMKLLGEEALMAGDVPSGCLYLWTYDELFRGLSSVRDELSACPAPLLEAYAASIPIPRYRSFPFPPGDREAARRD